MTGRRVWITRAQPGADATAARLSRLGLQPLTAPVLRVQALDVAIPLEGVGALAFTSANGVRAFAARIGRRDLPVFAVGEATASVARATGFARVESAAGDVAALAAYIPAHRSELHGAVLHPGPLRPAGDLIGELTRAGLIAHALAIYDTEAMDALPDAIAQALETGAIDAVLLHSPRAAATIANLLTGREDQAARLTAFGLSAACLAPLDRLALAQRVVAETPSEDALLARLVAP